jgi:hypothetical protein
MEVLDDFCGEAVEVQRDASKVKAAQEIITIAKKRGIPIAYVDKGVLNTLFSGSGSSTASPPRPHQGFVLRCGSLNFVNYDTVEPSKKFHIDPNNKVADIIQFRISLDEVVDPQNLRALLWSIYFFSNSNHKKIGLSWCVLKILHPYHLPSVPQVLVHYAYRPYVSHVSRSIIVYLP